MSELNKILYVEDDEDIAEVTQLTLTELGGFEVRHCASGSEAIRSIEVYQPQLLLLDVMMPNMDGPETLRHIHSKPGFEKLPVVFMTAKAQTHEQQEYIDMGALGVIIKPFDPLKLCDQIRSFWQSAKTV